MFIPYKLDMYHGWVLFMVNVHMNYPEILLNIELDSVSLSYPETVHF